MDRASSGERQAAGARPSPAARARMGVDGHGHSRLPRREREGEREHRRVTLQAIPRLTALRQRRAAAACAHAGRARAFTSFARTKKGWQRPASPGWGAQI
jgi:hypothetical protein